MHNQRRGLTLGIGIAVLAAVAALPVGWYLLSPLFVTRAVNEPPPIPAATQTLSMPAEAMATAGMPAEHMQATEAAMQAATSEAAMQQATDEMAAMAATAGMATEMAMPTESMPLATEAPAEPVALLMGMFYNVVHEGQGTATILELADGARVLRLDDFEVLNGPDLHVYLVPVDPVPYQVGVDIAGAVDLGQLKGNVGSQNYPLDAALDLDQFKSVVIWCQPFRVPFIAAALS
jgi:hypothetical protein